MRDYIVLILAMISFMTLSSQNKTSVEEVTKEFEALKNRGVQNIIIISNESDENLILWQEEGKEKALKIYNKNSNCLKKKKVRLSKKEKEQFNYCLNHYQYIEEVDNENCDERVHAFTEIIVQGLINRETKFSHTFYSNCGTEQQRQKIKPLISLYYNLL